MSKPTTKTDETRDERMTALQHVTAERDGTIVCTMFPQYRSEDDLSSEWLTATNDSFVSLDDFR